MDGQEGFKLPTEVINPPDLERREKIKFKYHYTFSDINMLGHPILHQFDANDDLTADEQFAQFIQKEGIDLTGSQIVRGSVEN